MRADFAIFLVLISPVVQAKVSPVTNFPKTSYRGAVDTYSNHIESISMSGALDLRGGAVKVAGPKKSVAARKGAFNALQESLQGVQPATRMYLLLCLFCTIVHLVGLPAPALFGLDAARVMELWRPLTSVAYLGGPSMSMANNLYFLVRYGQSLETLNGTGAHSWFLLVQTLLLGILGLILGFPFQAQAMISATVYVSSHLNPMEKMPFQFGLVITSWQLPFYMMAIDVLSQQNAAAAWPHVLGIFTGHVFHFFTKIWPSLGGKSWLQTPKWVLKRLGDKSNSNIPGHDFRSSKSEDELASSAKGKSKRRIPKGKARKLGDA